MLRRPLRLSALPAAGLVLALVLTGCGGGGGDAEGGTSAEGAPTFRAAELGGEGELASTSFEGQDTVLWFWAPWCTTCRAESGNVVAAAEALEGEVQVIGVAGRGEVPAMEDFVAETGTDGLTHVVDADGSIWSAYGVSTQPAFAFLDGDGSVEVVVGAQGEQALTERMEQLATA